MVKRNELNDRTKEQFRKIFIGGLNPKTDETSLKRFFTTWGEIVDVVVMKDKRSGRSRGFGFVTYRDAKSVDEAQLHRPHEIDGKIVETKRAMSRDDANNPESHLTVTKLFVGGLRKEVTSEELHKYFLPYGNILECEIVTWRESGESRGFGFVTFDDYDPVDKAVLCKPHIIGSSKTDVKKALTKDQINVIRKKEEETQYFNPQQQPTTTTTTTTTIPTSTMLHYPTTPGGDSVHALYPPPNWGCYYPPPTSAWLTNTGMPFCSQGMSSPYDAAALMCTMPPQINSTQPVLKSQGVGLSDRHTSPNMVFSE